MFTNTMEANRIIKPHSIRRPAFFGASFHSPDNNDPESGNQDSRCDEYQPGHIGLQLAEHVLFSQQAPDESSNLVMK